MTKSEIEFAERQRGKLVELLTDTRANAAWHHWGYEESADHLIANGVTVQEWISVNDPPMKHGCYLVTVKHWLDGKPVVREAYHNGSFWESCERRRDISQRVTHWMPMPQPPKGE